MGAVMAACYGAGLTGAELRAHVLALREDPLAPLIRHCRTALGAWKNPFSDMDGAAVLRMALPGGLPGDLAELAIPTAVVATDYHGRKATVFREGPLIEVLGASVAIPGVIAPATVNGRLYVDGGVTNNLPMDALPEGRCLAVDVASEPPDAEEGEPGPMALVAGSMRVMMKALLEARMEAARPAIFVQPESRRFGALDFLEARAILEAADPIKDEVKRRIAALDVA
jgi:NTE family protein